MCFSQQKEIGNFAKSENQGPKKKALGPNNKRAIVGLVWRYL